MQREKKNSTAPKCFTLDYHIKLIETCDTRDPSAAGNNGSL